MPLKEVDWDNFQFRCHYFGELMTKPKGKSNNDKYLEVLALHESQYKKVMEMQEGPKLDQQVLKLIDLDNKLKELAKIRYVPNLSDTCKRRLAQIYTEETTGRVKEIESIYLEKGLKTEEDSITLYSLRTGTMYRKNKERVSNGYIIGEIDFDDQEKDIVIDTKSSFDVFTFDATVAKSMGNNYWWQLQCYMWLKNRSKGRLAFCLNNTPNEILNRMKKRLFYNFIGDESDYQEACKKLEELHTYDDLPLERKIRIYETERDDEKIELAKQSIPHFREYLKNITNTKLEEDETTY